jgi:integrase
LRLAFRGDDPTRDIKLAAVKSDGFHTWTPEEIAQYEAHHAIGTKARLALALGWYTMQRRGDVIRMGRQHIRVGPKGPELHFTQQKKKTGPPHVLPVHPALAAIIEATPGDHLTLLTTKRGKAYCGGYFDDAFRAWCDDAGLPKRCTFHGLRKASLTWGADHGWTTHEIVAWSGHTSLSMVQHYTKASDQRRTARAALDRTLRENETGAEVVHIRRPM